MVSRNLARALGAGLIGGADVLEDFQTRKRARGRGEELRSILGGLTGRADEESRPFLEALTAGLGQEPTAAEGRDVLQRFASLGLGGISARRAGESRAQAAAQKAQSKLIAEERKIGRAEEKERFSRQRTATKDRASFIRQGLRDFDALVPEAFGANLSLDQKVEVLDALRAGQRSPLVRTGTERIGGFFGLGGTEVPMFGFEEEEDIDDLQGFQPRSDVRSQQLGSLEEILSPARRFGR